MIDFNERIAADMAMEYESGIADIGRKIEVLRQENYREKDPGMSKRIYALEVMKDDMEHQLWMLRKYADV